MRVVLSGRADVGATKLSGFVVVGVTRFATISTSSITDGTDVDGIPVTEEPATEELAGKGFDKLAGDGEIGSRGSEFGLLLHTD